MKNKFILSVIVCLLLFSEKSIAQQADIKNLDEQISNLMPVQGKTVCIGPQEMSLIVVLSYLRFFYSISKRSYVLGISFDYMNTTHSGNSIGEVIPSVNENMWNFQSKVFTLVIDSKSKTKTETENLFEYDGTLLYTDFREGAFDNTLRSSGPFKLKCKAEQFFSL